MKYIFGKDYEKDNIQIFCKKLTHNPILILSSDIILNHSLSYFSNQKITLLENQFNIANYFDTISIDDINCEDGKNIYIKYQNCTSTKGKENCENEWDDFSQFYWSTYYSDDYVDIPGFERYQISIDDNLIFQPSFQPALLNSPVDQPPEQWLQLFYLEH